MILFVVCLSSYDVIGIELGEKIPQNSKKKTEFNMLFVSSGSFGFPSYEVIEDDAPQFDADVS